METKELRQAMVDGTPVVHIDNRKERTVYQRIYEIIYRAENGRIYELARMLDFCGRSSACILGKEVVDMRRAKTETEKMMSEMHNSTANCDTCYYATDQAGCTHNCKKCDHKSEKGICLCFTVVPGKLGCAHYKKAEEGAKMI